MLIYLDSAASTPVDPDVFRAAQPFFMEQYGNPSSVHSMGRKAREAVEKARKQCAEALNCEPEQIFFTSGATESNQWALKMIDNYISIENMRHDKLIGYLLLDSLSHKSMLNADCSCYDVGIKFDENGVIKWSETVKGISPGDKATVAINWINNEIGTAQPIGEINDYCYEHNIPLHVDATQGIGKHSVNLKKWKGITTLSMSGHKIGAPKGVGLLFIRNPKAEWVEPLLYGGGQEGHLRAGTENVPGIVGLGVAMEKIGSRTRDEWIKIGKHVREMRDYLKSELSKIPYVRFNGDCEFQFPYYLNVSFKGILGETLALRLDARDIFVSTGSACNSGSLKPSHVLTAIGLDSEYIDGTIRISLSEMNTLEECKVVAEAIKEEVAKLRSVSPTWKGE